MVAALIVLLSLASTFGAGVAAAPATVRVPDARRELTMAAVVNLALVPVLAWVGARGLGLGPAGAGLVVAAAAPGGSTGPLLAALAGGDAAVAAALFVALTVAGSGTALIATLAYDVAGWAQVARAALIVTAIGLAPLAVGALVRGRRPQLAARLAPWTSRVGALLLIAVVAALIITRSSPLAPARALALSAALVGASMAPALLIGDRARRLAVAQVGAVRNLTLALVVLTAVAAPPAAVGATLSFGLVMYAATALVAAAARRR